MRYAFLLGVVVSSCVLCIILCRPDLRRALSDLLFRLSFARAILRQQKPVSGTPLELFRQEVLNPIPRSVKEIRVDRTQEVFGYGLTFRFKIDVSDVDLIIQARPFKRMTDFTYQNRVLHWDVEDSPGGTVLLYPSDSHVPPWFTLGTTENAQGYVVMDDEGYRWSMWMLIYDRELRDRYRDAFFIISRGTH